MFRGKQMSGMSFYGLCAGSIFIAFLIASIAYLFLGVPLLLFPLLALPTSMAVVVAVFDFGPD